MKDNSNIPQDLLEIIESYLDGTMTTQELKDFNRLLELDEDFRTQVEDVKTMLYGIEAQSLKEDLDEFHKDVSITETEKNITSGKVRFLNYSKLAAAAAIVVAVGSIWFFSGNPNQSIYSKYYSPDPGLATTMSSSETDFEFLDAMVNYKHGDYDLAIKKWGALSEKEPENDTLNYFIGSAYLANKNEAEAIPFLERAVEAEDDFVFLNDAYFYLGLAYIKEGNVELAKKYLTLSETDSAKIILSELTD
ncbi:tetratricopeptide repeat protein [Hyunsoonleella rubra]|uniref:Tol-pal system YbgF family protein n=1 Tax=Hyunsoonleella rubra TaxID=1737062 RepID=A0ABW5T844_9FLAO